MKKNGQLFLNEKALVRLTLERLSAQGCLTYAGRYFFSPRGKHPRQHPLMYQIDTNPDCMALAVAVEGTPLALCFFGKTGISCSVPL